MTRSVRVTGLVALIAAAASPSLMAQARGGHKAIDPAGIQRLKADTGGTAQISIHEATGAARFVRLARGKEAGAESLRTNPAATAHEKSAAFLRQYGSIFGIADIADLQSAGVRPDQFGGTHLTYRQFYRGVPVFGGVLKTHFDATNQLRAVNGSVVPSIAVNTVASQSPEAAAKLALRKVEDDLGAAGTLSVGGTNLYVYRKGLAQGVPGSNHLAWEVEVGNGTSVREFVYVDAHNGKFVDQISGVQDALFRRAYDGMTLPTVPPSYPGAPFWVEGDPFPTGTTEADNMILASKETYDFYNLAFGRDSFDGAGAVMDSIFNRGYSCPNASWNGTFISFCAGLTTDDVTGHEWTHAYTQYTHGLIYQWQPGALNEAYSDIFGETVDRINGRLTDDPNTLRTADTCSAFSPPKAQFVINSPASIAGTYPAQGASFGPALSTTGITGNVVLADDGVGVGADACTALTAANAALMAGNIALIDRGTCTFTTKVKNAQNAGAVAAIVANNVSTGLPGMGGADATITISSLGITQGDGNKVKANIPAPGTNVTLRSAGGTTDNSVRWLLGEDDTGALAGALRDMWNPTCYSNPGKVSDLAYYTCATTDAGGVHTNSGVPNHGYSLTADGGTYNGQTINGLGLTKAAHIYFRAMNVYQTPTTDFTDHADALAQSCTDLIGVDLNGLNTGAPSGEILTAADCDELAKVALAVELRTPPTQCNFQPLLAKTPPSLCADGTTQVNLFADDFETDPASRWAVSHDAVFPLDFTDRDWAWANTLPSERAGSAFFAVDPSFGTCAPGGDESGVLHATSPVITVPSGVATPLLTFEHWVATESGFDGGNLRVSVNGGLFQLVASADYTYNAYNQTLITAAGGNTDPLAGQTAFSGTDGGSVQGSWGRSHVNLSNYAHAGDTVQLRWDFGTDGCGGVFGWYLDDVTVYACPASGTPSLSVNDISVTEGNSGQQTATFTVSLSAASSQPVTVRFKGVPGTAKKGRDFTMGKGVITIPALSLSATVSGQVFGDTTPEPDETFSVVLSNPVNATLGDNLGQCTILNDDGTPLTTPGVSAAQP